MSTHRLPFPALAVAGCLASCAQPPAEAPEEPLTRAQRAVNLPVSCSDEAAAAMRRGVSDLHNMMYVTARDIFEEALAADGDCVMADWGVAMTHIHPLWVDAPTEEIIVAMQRRIGQAMEKGASTERERAYLSTVEAFFAGGLELTERERLARFADAWQAVAENHPDDLEAQAFYSLAYLATADIDDKSYVVQKKSGAFAVRSS